jgi:hypothetical protein
MIWLDGQASPPLPDPWKNCASPEDDLIFSRQVSPSTRAPSHVSRKFGIAAFAALAVLLCSGATSSTGCPSSSDPFGPSDSEVIGAAVDIGAAIAFVTVVLVEVNRSHHALSGCVISGSSGLKLQTNDSRNLGARRRRGEHQGR